MAGGFPIRLFQPNHSSAIEEAALAVLRSGQIAGGPLVDAFQRQLGDWIGRPHVVCTSDMTSSLVLALRSAGIGPGDEVLTLAFSCMASNAAITLVGASPVWVDLDPATAAMSLSDLERAITPRCRAVTLYHVAGYPAPAAEVGALCSRKGLVLIEDCNNALGATSDGVPVGQHGEYATYSFYPNRQINAIEGGAVVCPDAATADHVTRLRRFGIDLPNFRDATGEIDPEADIPEIGISASFNHLNAAVGLSQFPTLSHRIARTRHNAERLLRRLEGIAGVTLVVPIDGANPAYWGALILAERRDTVLAGLKRRGVLASKLHQRNDVYTGFSAARRPLPGTDLYAEQEMALPCGWWLSDEQVDTVADAVREEASR